MPAAKTAPEPALRDLAAEIQRATIRAQGELDDARRRLDALRTERESILNKPLAAVDLLPELERHLRRKAAEAGQYLRESLAEMRDRSPGYATTNPSEIACYAPLERATLPEVIAVLVDPADAARRLLAAAGELPGVEEGLPLVERRAAVAELDKQIAAAEQHESELIAGLQAAGIRIAMPGDPEPEPEPGERRMIGGRLQQWATFNGRDYGWWPVETEQAA